MKIIIIKIKFDMSWEKVFPPPFPQHFTEQQYNDFSPATQHAKKLPAKKKKKSQWSKRRKARQEKQTKNKPGTSCLYMGYSLSRKKKPKKKKRKWNKDLSIAATWNGTKYKRGLKLEKVRYRKRRKKKKKKGTSPDEVRKQNKSRITESIKPQQQKQ